MKACWEMTHSCMFEVCASCNKGLTDCQELMMHLRGPRVCKSESLHIHWNFSISHMTFVTCHVSLWASKWFFLSCMAKPSITLCHRTSCRLDEALSLWHCLCPEKATNSMVGGSNLPWSAYFSLVAQVTAHMTFGLWCIGRAVGIPKSNTVVTRMKEERIKRLV